jgi:hypothetical protein
VNSLHVNSLHVTSLNFFHLVITGIRRCIVHFQRLHEYTFVLNTESTHNDAGLRI